MALAHCANTHAGWYVLGAAVLRRMNRHNGTQAAQVGGSVLGARLAIVLIPDRLQQSFAGFGIGMRPGVLLWQGLLCELALALVLNVIVLWSLNANPYIAYWTLMGATLVLMVAGAELTGPSLNPAIVRGACAIPECMCISWHPATIIHTHRAWDGLSTFRGTHCWSMCWCSGLPR